MYDISWIRPSSRIVVDGQIKTVILVETSIHGFDLDIGNIHTTIATPHYDFKVKFSDGTEVEDMARIRSVTEDDLFLEEMKSLMRK